MVRVKRGIPGLGGVGLGRRHVRERQWQVRHGLRKRGRGLGGRGVVAISGWNDGEGERGGRSANAENEGGKVVIKLKKTRRSKLSSKM